jgi:UDPglucose 6-dehydrogenase
MKIAMVGSGYVGLVSGACFADFGHEVVCIDKDEAKIARLCDGLMPIYEPGLEKLVDANVKAGRLSFTTDLAGGIAGAEAIFIAVGTPSRRGDGHADLSFVYAVAEEIGASLSNDAVVVTKSTVPVGTGDEVERILAESGTTHRSPWSPTPNSCAKAPRSATSSAPTGSSSVRRTISAARSCARSIARCS